MKSFLIFLMLALSLPLHADSYTPAADDSVQLAVPLPLTARMTELNALLIKQPDDTAALELSSLYLQGARKPGFDDWFHQAEHWLSTVSLSGKNNVNFHLLRADIQQQQHQFDIALLTLNQVFSEQPYHITASLMAARIYLATAQQQAAQRACSRLWQQDLFLFSACSYEVAGRNGNWQQSYLALVGLYQRQATLPVEIDIWMRGILAEQAEQLGQADVALQWLSPVLETAPTSLWLKWADLSLQLAEPQQVYQLLLAKHQHFGLADSLLLRLAQAEQQLGVNTGIRAELEQRMQLRLARGDTEHTADLAIYFLRIQPNAKAAHYWAELNYQSAKEPDDLALLEQSKLALMQLTEVKK